MADLKKNLIKKLEKQNGEKLIKNSINKKQHKKTLQINLNTDVITINV